MVDMIRTFWPALLASVALQAAASPLWAQDKTKEATAFSKDQLEQMVGPIALYPDNLIASVFTGATYPLEIVEADRWVDQNKDKKGADLEKAMKDQDWDPAVKSLVMVPEVLDR